MKIKYDNKVWILSDGYYIISKKIYLHRYIWEQHNGKIPEGYLVHHKDGNKTNNSLDNLELLERPDHQRLHVLANPISHNGKGKKLSVETKLKMKAAKELYYKSHKGTMYGKKHSVETKRKMSETRKLLPCPCSFRGHRHTEETKRKIKSTWQNKTTITGVGA